MPLPRDPTSDIAGGAAAGAALGGAAAAAVVPCVQAIGFTSTGIAAGSTAASMMSASAVMSGGGVASGSTVAVLQSIGAVGAISIGATAGIVVGAVAVGAAAAVAFRSQRSQQHETLDVKTVRRTDVDHYGMWIIATEEGRGKVFVCRYASKTDACTAFDKIWCSRILYDPKDQEVKSQGKQNALETIRNAIHKHYCDKTQLFAFVWRELQRFAMWFMWYSIGYPLVVQTVNGFM